MDTNEFDDVLETVRTFVRNEVIPAEDVIEEADEIPASIRAKAAAMGLFGFALPQEYGGLGLSMTEDVRLAFELGYTTPAFRSMLGTNNGIAGQVLVNFGTDEQKDRYLPDLASGAKIASFALTEAEAGSDPSGMKARADRVPEGYRLNGQKLFITNASHADVFMVFARTRDEPGTTNGISAFCVEADTEGLTVAPKDEKMGQRGSNTAAVSFDDVLVPEFALVGGVEGEGFSAAMRSLSRGRLHIAAVCVGLAQRLVEESVTYAAAAKQGGKSIARFQQVQALLADSQTEMYAGQAMVLEAARAFDDRSDRRLAPSCAKLFCAEMVGRVADRAVQIHGGMGYMHSVPVERFYRDARLFRLYEGTSEVQRVIIAKQLLKGRAT